MCKKKKKKYSLLLESTLWFVIAVQKSEFRADERREKKRVVPQRNALIDQSGSDQRSAVLCSGGHTRYAHTRVILLSDAAASLQVTCV